MGYLDIHDKIALMIDSLQTAKRMLNDDSIRPSVKVQLEDYVKVLREDLKELYIEFYRIIRN